MRTSSRNGFGTQLLFHRPVSPGLFEATVWVVACYFPLFPRSTWLIRPQGSEEKSIVGGTSTTHFTEFIERRKTPLSRILWMYLCVVVAVVAMWAPMILGFVALDRDKSLNKSWVGAALVLIPLIWAVALWVWLDIRRDRLYKRAMQQVAREAFPGPIQ